MLLMMKDLFIRKEFLFALFLLVNIFTYFIYFLDKKRAIKKKKRISEKKLLLSTFLFGGIGAWIAMHQFRHKTKQLKFKVLVPLAGFLSLIELFFMINY